MKSKYMIGALLFGIISLFASCSDDNDSNPTLIQPTEFSMNTPAYANTVVDLEHSKELSFSWSQPKYTADHAPINVTYEVQVSPSGSFTVSADEAAADESGNTVADYDIMSKTTQKCSVDISAEDIDKGLVRVMKFAEDAVPAEQEISVRINAYILEGTKKLNAIASNVVKLKVNPYFVELKDATPIMWYLVGNMFGSKWGDKKEDIGVNALPMFLKPNFSYDKKTGTGEIEYTNFFTTGTYKENGDVDGSGFKIQSDFDWTHSMNAKGNVAGTIVYRATEGESGHCVAPKEGYWTIKLNTANNTATMVEYKGEVDKTYGTIQIAGSFNGWTDTPMLPYNTVGVENHAWYYVMDVPAGGVTFKFKIADGDKWGKAWGYGSQKGAVNMYGKCGTGGDEDLGLEEEGKYVISFNDITGSFSIVKL